MSDIVDILRLFADEPEASALPRSVMRAAADEIERLRADVVAWTQRHDDLVIELQRQTDAAAAVREIG